jgi:chromosome segregation ATPase
MCAKLYFIWFLLIWLCLSAPAVQGEEQYYLISETELRSIETSLGRLETDRQSWESQARGLRNEAGNLNNQLAGERRQYRILEQSFNRYETDQLTQISLKNGEIAELKQEKAQETQKKEEYKGKYRTWMIISIALSAAWVIFIVFKIYQKFRVL